MKAVIVEYPECKYSCEEDGTRIYYDNIESFEVKEIAKEDLSEHGIECVDDFDEYLFIMLPNGATQIFENSKTDLFKY